MSASQAKLEAAEALYRSITEHIKPDTSPRTLEQLAQAYALVAQHGG